jgi:hypothetical protein
VEHHDQQHGDLAGKEMTRFIMFLLCLTCVLGCGRQTDPSDDADLAWEKEEQRKRTEWIPDPSSAPIKGISTPFAERLRLLTDVDGDGIEDMVLSFGLDNFGNGGGPCELYLRNKEGLCKYVCDMGSDLVAIEHVDLEYQTSRIWTAGKGDTQYEILLEALTIKNGKATKKEAFTVFTETDGNGKISQNISDSVFGHSDAPIYMEWSTTTNNTVIWRGWDIDKGVWLPPREKK